MEDINQFFQKATQYYAEQCSIRKKIREQSKAVCGDMLYAYALACGVLSDLIKYKIGVPGKTNDSISTRLYLIASIYQGIDLCEVTISEGVYGQAATLIRQEIETIAAIVETEKGIRKDGSTPRVKQTGVGFEKHYGYFSGIAHASDSRYFEPIYKAIPCFEGQKPISLVPQFDAESCRYFYGAHLSLLLKTIYHLSILLNEMYGFQFLDEHREAITIITKALDNEGMLVSKEKSV